MVKIAPVLVASYRRIILLDNLTFLGQSLFKTIYDITSHQGIIYTLALTLIIVYFDNSTTNQTINVQDLR